MASAQPDASSSAVAATSPTAATSAAAGSVAALPGNGLSGTNAPTAGPAPDGFVAKVCAAITIPDAQAVVKATITKIDAPVDSNEDPNGAFQCNIDEADQALMVSIEPEDSSKANYTTDVAAENVPPVAVPGVGDVAVYTQALHNPPDFYAHKGNATCEIQTGDIRDLNLTNDPALLDGGVSNADAAAYAAKLGVICRDVFGAISVYLMLVRG